MIKNYLLTAWRNFYKQKTYTLINVFGLSIGIACSIILFLFINYHLSFDNYHPNANNIYRIVTGLHLDDGSIEYEQGSPLILGQTLKQRLPAIANETVLLNKRAFTVSVPKYSGPAGNLFYEYENIAFTDSNWFKIFSYNWKFGNANKALTEANTAVITSNLAIKYFNTDNVIGKTIMLDNKQLITITGVLQNTAVNTDVRAQMFISLPTARLLYSDVEQQLFNNWGYISSKNNVFILLAPGASLPQVNGSIKAFTKQAFNADANVFQFQLQPLADVHFNSRYSGTISKPLLLILGLVGIALILIACVNFINMATAQSFARAKEIGTRRVLGSTQGGIFWQFITEAAYVVATGAVVGLITALLFLPVINSWLQLPLSLNINTLIFLVILLAVIVFTAGFYPAVILSRFKPVNALKNIISSSNPASRLSRSLLIISQNIIAQVLIVSTLIITLQVKYLKNADLGFNKDAVVMVPLPHGNPVAPFHLRHELAGYSGVKNVSLCYRAPASTSGKGGSIRYDHKPWEKFAVRSIVGDTNYVKTFGLKLLAGRNLSTDSSTNEFLVNQQLLEKLGIKRPEDAIGHLLTAGDFNDKDGTIVGVVKDFNSHALYAPVEPVLITANPGYYEYAAIKVAGNDEADIIQSIKQKWQQAFPENVFEYHFLDQQIAGFYQKEDMINKLIKASTIVAILISCLGMTGLISLITAQRTKEIGIRKILGASVSSIVTLLASDFLKLVAIAVTVSTPLAWWAMHTWLQNFAFHIPVQWWVFGLSAVAALLIALLTVSVQSIKASLSNPVESIRNN